MKHHLVPYRYNTYTDALIAIGTAQLAERLYGLDANEVILRAQTSGFHIEHPETNELHDDNPFYQIRDKESREVDGGTSSIWDKTLYGANDDKPSWWKTVSVINSLATPVFNNNIAQSYTPELGFDLLQGTAEVNTGSMSQLLYAQASKGVNSTGGSTSQGNLSADAEQMLAHLGYQTGAAGFIQGDYTISIVPRPGAIRLSHLRDSFVEGFLRGYLPKTDGGKILPPRSQTVPFFIAMTYFDFIIQLFNYREEHQDLMDQFFADEQRGVGKIISSLDRVMYYSMGTSSAPFVSDSLAIPEWLDDKSLALNVRDLVRELLSEHTDPHMLYLPVRAFAESDPRPLVEFYRKYEPLRAPSGGNRTGKRLLHQSTLRYIMDKTGYDDLNCPEMQRFARALRSRTLTKLYRDGQNPDFELLTRLRSASRNKDRLVSMLSAFVGSYNLSNARHTAVGKPPDGPNLNYEDLQVIIGLINNRGAEFVANTLMAQAMSKRDQDAEPEDAEDIATA